MENAPTTSSFAKVTVNGMSIDGLNRFGYDLALVILAYVDVLPSLAFDVLVTVSGEEYVALALPLVAAIEPEDVDPCEWLPCVVL